LGRCRALLVPAHWLLHNEERSRRRREESFHYEPYRRLGFHPRRDADVLRYRSVSFFANPAAGEAATTALSFFKDHAADPFTLGAITAGGATTIALLLFIGAAGKSAQIPLYVWLPDAMAGPTPVSALIHAATMVTAGIYLIVVVQKSSFNAPTTMFIVAIVGAATALFRGHDRYCAERHQKSSCLLNRLATRVHVSRLWSRCVRCGHLPRHHARVL
jgi:hypothetical protein